MRLVEDARDPLAGQEDRDADDDLIESEPDAEDDHENRGAGSSRRTGEVREPDGMAVVGTQETEVRAEEHHPLQADVEHAGPFRDRLAERGEHERHSVEEPAGERGRPEDLRPDSAREDHAVCLRMSGARRACLRPGVR